MSADLDSERPTLRLPFNRIERASGLLFLILASLPVSFVIFVASQFIKSLERPFMALGGLYAVVLVFAIAEYLTFEERISINSDAVHFVRKALFRSLAWTERLKNYTGVAVITASGKNGTPAAGTERPHWSRRSAPKLIRLVAKDPSHSVTLWEFDARDFPAEINHKLRSFSDLLGVESLPEQTG